MIAAWLVRDAAMWFRARRPGPRWRARWETTMAAAAITFAASTATIPRSATENMDVKSCKRLPSPSIGLDGCLAWQNGS